MIDDSVADYKRIWSTLPVTLHEDRLFNNSALLDMYVHFR